MTTLTEAARAALEALTNCSSEHGHRCNRCDSEVDEGNKVAEALRAALAASEVQAEPVALTWDQESRGMFVARLENMQRNGDQWLTVPAVLALLNDCDYLALRDPPAPEQPAQGLADADKLLQAFARAWDFGDVDERRRTGDAIRAALASAPRVPQGWKLVPVEPTQEMCQQGQWKAQEWPKFPLRIAPIYAAMLAAAPQPEGDTP
jgi:hypothetical protein